MEFNLYKRKETLNEMLPIKEFIEQGGSMEEVSISQPDSMLEAEVFYNGYIARNPKNHDDKWYVSSAYFGDNLINAPITKEQIER